MCCQEVGRQNVHGALWAVDVRTVKVVTKEGKSKTVEESGSGVLFRPSFFTPPEGADKATRGAYVLTNNHVIAQAEARQITVSLADDRIFSTAQVWAEQRGDRQSSSACLAWSETWVKPRG